VRNRDEMRSMVPSADLLLERWSPGYINVVEEVTGKRMDVDRKIILASCLENTNSTLRNASDLYETTMPSDVGPFKKFALELVSAVVPSLVAYDIVSVQPMSNRIGEIRYIKYLYGTKKGSVAAGTEYSSALNFTGGNFNYSSEIIDTEVIGTSGETQYVGNLEYTPVRPGTVQITVGSSVITDDGAGNLLAPAGILAAAPATHKVSYADGAFDFTLAAVADSDISATYEYNLENNPNNIPQIDIKMEIIPVLARSRKLRALYAFESAYDMQRDYGVDINAALVANIASEIRHEIDGEILNDLFVQAGAQGSQSITWSKTPPAGISVRDHYESFWNKVIQMSNVIFNATKRASGTFIVGGAECANIVESLPDFVPSGATGVVGPHVAGTIRGYTFIKNPYYPTNAFVVGYKGATFLEAGYTYLPYLPVMSTSLIMLDDFIGRRGFATSYAKKMTNNKLYCKGTITA